MMRTLKNKSGFTLIEIIISLTILTTMVVTMTQVTENLAMTRARAEARADTRRSLTLAWQKVFDDLRPAFITRRSFEGRESQFISGLIGDAETLSFSTLGHVHYVKNKKDTDSIHVGYRLERNEAGLYDLIRRETNTLEDDLEDNDKGRSFPILRDIKEWEWSYYDPNSKEYKDEWDTTSVRSGRRLPRLVKAVFTVLARSADDEAEVTDRKEIQQEWLVSLDLYKARIDF